MMMNTCFNSRFHSAPSFVTPYLAIASPSCRRYSDRHRGFSLPEVMVALLLVMLGASTLISTMAAARSRAASNIKFSVAFRLATELSEWTRQGGLRALAAETENSFDLLIASHSELNCFSKPCNAEEASIFYLYHWRRRLLLEVHDARVVICQGLPAARANQYKWECEEVESGSHSRVIKIGWGQGSRPGVHNFPPRLILALG